MPGLVWVRGSITARRIYPAGGFIAAPRGEAG